MDLMEFGDMASGCEDENCGLASGFPDDCSGQECPWEEPVFGLIELVCVTVIYIPLMLFGLLGNILTILVVWLRPHMRSSTYLYLSSMAVSDLLILLLLPLDLYKIWRPKPWPLGDLACKLTMFLSECCTFCTILHITFLSLERYLAVCWPITAKTLVTRRRTRVLIGCLWLGAAVSAAPVLVMVGVEEVGGEELGLGDWREGGGWIGGEGEQQGFIIGGSQTGKGELGGIKWGEEKEGKQWGETAGELKQFGEKRERRLGIRARDERTQGNEGGGEEEGKIEVEGERQNKMREDEGGGREELDWDQSHSRGEIDERECRCTDYAVTSGLLSAMMILSNLYFLVPFCILGLVYSLIGRTLWLRPQSSRRDQSHRHTVKMLGVIVLAFVLCWLPFHVGRTIFFFSRGTATDMDTNSHLEMNTLSDISMDGNVNIHRERDETVCDFCAKTTVTVEVNSDADTHSPDIETNIIGKQSDAKNRDTQLCSHAPSTTGGQHTTSGTRIPNLVSTNEMGTDTDTNSDTAHLNRQLGRFTDNRSTNYNVHHDRQETAHINTKGLHSNTNLHADPSINRPSCSENHTLTRTKNRTTICMNSQHNTTSHTPATSRTHTYAVRPIDLSSGNGHSDMPFNNTYMDHDTDLYFLYYLSQYFNLVSSVLFYLSAAVNPLLYNLMSARYRHAVHSLIHTHSHTQAHRLRTLTTRHSTTTL